MTQEQKDFIINNRLKMSIPKIVKASGVTTHHVRKFLRQNNLELNEDQKRHLRSLAQYEYLKTKPNKAKENKWCPDPWNRGLNTITMLMD